MAEVAEQHGHELGPTGEPLGRLLRAVLPHQLLEFPARYLPQQLTEQTRVPYHGVEVLLCW
jgi:hypothetical protein